MDVENPHRRMFKNKWMLIPQGGTLQNRSGDDFDYSSWWNSYWNDQNLAAELKPEEEELLPSSESDSSFEFENYAEEAMVNQTKPGNILHFVPSMQMKLLKGLNDFHYLYSRFASAAQDSTHFLETDSDGIRNGNSLS